MAASSSRKSVSGAPSAHRKQLGAWYTPDDLVATIVDNVVTDEFLDGFVAKRETLKVLDPACGDGRFLAAVAARAAQRGVACEVLGVDIDPAATDAARLAMPGAQVVCADALLHDFGGALFDLVIGNPPFLSQMAAATTRGGASGRGGGAYADAAVEFLALAGELVEPDGGRVAFVLPQSILGARDAGQVRAAFDERSQLFWSSWTGERVFDAQVHTCVLAFQFGPDDPRLRQEICGSADKNLVTNVDGSARGQRGLGNWAFVVTARQGIPELPVLETNGRVGDRATLNANFRDEYYGMIPAVGDHEDGPALITSGLIDPGCTQWGRRRVTFAKRHFAAPRIDVDAFDQKMQQWAHRRLVPKVLVANQTSIIEAVCDPAGQWLPAVPVIGVYPTVHLDVQNRGQNLRADIRQEPRRSAATIAWEIAAVLTSPIASAWVWHHSAGTGLSATAIRLGPGPLGSIAWPSGDLGVAVKALRDGDVRACGLATFDAYGVDDAGERERLFSWWVTALDRIEARAGRHA